MIHDSEWRMLAMPGQPRSPGLGGTMEGSGALPWSCDNNAQVPITIAPPIANVISSNDSDADGEKIPVKNA
jgi:hypothetical protein